MNEENDKIGGCLEFLEQTELGNRNDGGISKEAFGSLWFVGEFVSGFTTQ